MIGSTYITPLRPRDFDIETIQRAAGYIAKGIDELSMHLCAYAYFLDNDQLPDATDALAKAELFCRESALDPPSDWYSIFVFANAYLRRDAATARLWWERMEATKSFRFSDGLWASQSALLWSERRLEEAREAWKKADAWTCQLPESGFREAERNAVTLLRQALCK
jgi:hypothetical protein